MDAAIGNGLQFSLVVGEFFVLVAQGFESFLDGFLGGAAGGGVELFLGAINLKERVGVVVLARSQCEFGPTKRCRLKIVVIACAFRLVHLRRGSLHHQLNGAKLIAATVLLKRHTCS